jgi:hydrogenase maturation protease
VTTTLVIGIGNTLAGDDGIGARVVRRLRRRTGIRVLVVQQLTPELAEEIAGAARVIFVDAGLTGTGAEVATLTPATTWPPLIHKMSPAELLGFAAALYRSRPEAFAVTVRGHAFAPGAGLSARSRRDLSTAVERIEALLGAPETAPDPAHPSPK